MKGWLIETTDGIVYWLLVNDECISTNIQHATSMHKGPWYLIVTTHLKGSKNEILNSVSQESKVTIKSHWAEYRLESIEVTTQSSNFDVETIIFNEDNIRLLLKIQ
jgi:hypothetical protein